MGLPSQSPQRPTGVRAAEKRRATGHPNPFPHTEKSTSMMRFLTTIAVGLVAFGVVVGIARSGRTGDIGSALSRLCIMIGQAIADFFIGLIGPLIDGAVLA